MNAPCSPTASIRRTGGQCLARSPGVWERCRSRSPSIGMQATPQNLASHRRGRHATTIHDGNQDDHAAAAASLMKHAGASVLMVLHAHTGRAARNAAMHALTNWPWCA